MEKHFKLINVIVFALILAVFLMGSIMTPPKDFSENENRVLQKAPVFSWESLASGKFTKDLEKYIADHFLSRDTWVGMKSNIERLLLKKENNGIYFGHNDYLFEKFPEPDWGKLDTNITEIRDFLMKNKNIPSRVMFIPTSASIYKDFLPSFTGTYDQNMLIKYITEKLGDEITLIDPSDTLNKHKNEYIYYRTDHHWTQLGAWYAYIEYCKSAGLKPALIGDFLKEVLSEDFRGSYYSKSGYWNIRPDVMEALVPAGYDSIEVFYDGGNKSEKLYDRSFLNKKDKYSLFLGGVHALVHIKTNIKNGKSLLVIRDSYASSFAPYLVNHYENIYVVDMRYYNGNMSKYMDKYSIDEILVLYGLKSICDDTSIVKLD